MNPSKDKLINNRDDDEPESDENLQIERESSSDIQIVGPSPSYPNSEPADSAKVAKENPDITQTPDESDSVNANLLDVETFDDGSKAVQVIDVTPPVVAAIERQPIGSDMGRGWEVLRLLLIPVLILAACVGGIAMLGLAQRSGWIQSAMIEGESSQVGLTSGEMSASTTYMCPMLCVPPTNKPGRCPVCAMELVPVSSGSSSGPSSKIQIDPRSRRVAGIETVPATLQTLFREVRGVGEITYDESKLKTLSAYIDGRIEELYADYTGIEVKKGDSLALIYSPDLYAAQVEYARTKEFAETAKGGSSRSADSNRRLLDSSRERLIELGMTEDQIKELERTKTPNSRMALHAPMSGTVIEKMAEAGQYIKAGMPVYKLADLSSVWLVLELFPEDARVIEIGQKVIATTQSMSGPPFEGKVQFVEPTVDSRMRTVGVRVEIKNEHGHLKPGEFVRATLKIPLLSKFGEPQETVVVPRNSLLTIGPTSLVYVEGKPGEFELRHVKTGPTVEGQIAIFEGLSAGENVVAHSTFLLDAQMQLQGNPSLIDPDKAVMDDEVQLTDADLEENRKAMAPLSEEDRKLAKAQVICPVTEVRLGSMGMGTPIKLVVEGRTVFICCEGCRSMWFDEPEKYFQILDDYLAGKSNQPKPAMESAIPRIDVPQMELPQMELPK